MTKQQVQVEQSITPEGDLLPFGLGKLLPQEHHQFGDLKIPRKGSLTVGEYIMLYDLPKEASGAEYDAMCVELLIKSRCSDAGEFSLKAVPHHLLKPAIEFFRNELREWQEVDSVEAATEEAKKHLTGPKSTGGSVVVSPTSPDSSQTSSKTARSGCSGKRSPRSRKTS